MVDEEERYEPPEKFRRDWFAWLETVVEYATVNHHADLLAAVITSNYLRAEGLLYKQLRQSKRQARRDYNIPSVWGYILGRRASIEDRDAYEAHITSPDGIPLIERLIDEGDLVFGFTGAAKREYKRKYHHLIFRELSYTKMIELRRDARVG